MNPLLRALEVLGGSGSVEEIYDKVVELEALSDEVLSHLHDPDNSTNTEVWYRLAWARTYLKKFGLVDNSTRGVWSLTAKAKRTSVRSILKRSFVLFALRTRRQQGRSLIGLNCPTIFQMKRHGSANCTRSSPRSSAQLHLKGSSSVCCESQDSRMLR